MESYYCLCLKVTWYIEDIVSQMNNNTKSPGQIKLYYSNLWHILNSYNLILCTSLRVVCQGINTFIKSPSLYRIPCKVLSTHEKKSCYFRLAQSLTVFEQFHFTNFTHKTWLSQWYGFSGSFQQWCMLGLFYQNYIIKKSPPSQINQSEIWTRIPWLAC